jgi:hypothetical protein
METDASIAHIGAPPWLWPWSGSLHPPCQSQPTQHRCLSVHHVHCGLCLHELCHVDRHRWQQRVARRAWTTLPLQKYFHVRQSWDSAVLRPWNLLQRPSTLSSHQCQSSRSQYHGFYDRTRHRETPAANTTSKQQRGPSRRSLECPSMRGTRHIMSCSKRQDQVDASTRQRTLFRSISSTSFYESYCLLAAHIVCAGRLCSGRGQGMASWWWSSYCMLLVLR